MTGIGSLYEGLDMAKVMLGQRAFHIPFNMIVQPCNLDEKDGTMAGVFQTRHGLPLMVGSRKTHVLLLGTCTTGRTSRSVLTTSAVTGLPACCGMGSAARKSGCGMARSSCLRSKAAFPLKRNEADMADPTPLAMEFLVGLYLEERIVTRDGQLYLSVPGAGEQPVTVETLDDLEARGWLVPGWTEEDPNPPKPTDKGLYWMHRYMHQKYGKKGG